MTYTYANPQNTRITDGQGSSIPVDETIAEYRKLIADNVTIEPYVAPPDPVPDLTVRQFMIGLHLNGMITEAEARDRNTIPVAIDAVFGTLPPSGAAAARITWAMMTSVPRNDPMVDALGPVFNKTPEEIDDFFRQAALI
jgi:hypothetical protein